MGAGRVALLTRDKKDSFDGDLGSAQRRDQDAGARKKNAPDQTNAFDGV